MSAFPPGRGRINQDAQLSPTTRTMSVAISLQQRWSCCIFIRRSELLRVYPQTKSEIHVFVRSRIEVCGYQNLQLLKCRMTTNNASNQVGYWRSCQRADITLDSWNGDWWTKYVACFKMMLAIDKCLAAEMIFTFLLSRLGKVTGDHLIPLITSTFHWRATTDILPETQRLGRKFRPVFNAIVQHDTDGI